MINAFDLNPLLVLKILPYYLMNGPFSFSASHIIILSTIQNNSFYENEQTKFFLFKTVYGRCSQHLKKAVKSHLFILQSKN